MAGEFATLFCQVGGLARRRNYQRQRNLRAKTSAFATSPRCQGPMLGRQRTAPQSGFWGESPHGPLWHHFGVTSNGTILNQTEQSQSGGNCSPLGFWLFRQPVNSKRLDH